MDFLQVVFLALVQGVTEFLPISSSAHLVLSSELTGWPDQGLAFDIAVHLGSLAGVLLCLRGDCRAFASSGWRWMRTGHCDQTLGLLLKLGAASLPIAILGYALYDLAEAQLRTLEVIACATIVFALVLWWADARRGVGEALSWRNALLIGCAQALAILPGASRSGLVLSAGLLLGLSRMAATRIAFLLAVPAIAAAALLAFWRLPSAPGPAQLFDLGAGVALAAASAYLCVRFFIALVERTGLLPYVAYRLLLGLALIGVLLAR